MTKAIRKPERFFYSGGERELASYLYVHTDKSDNEELDENGKVYDIDVGIYRSYASNIIDTYHYLRENLKDGMTDEEIMFHFYEQGKKYYGKENLRLFFLHLYVTLFGVEDGTRIGTFVNIMGVDSFLDMMQEKVFNPWDR